MKTKIKSIVLSNVKFRDNSLIISVLSDKLSKIQIFASGIYNKKQNLAGTVDFFSVSNMVINKSKNTFYLTESDLLLKSKFDYNNFNKYILCNLVSEIIDKSIPEGYYIPNLYEMTEMLIYMLNDGADPFILTEAWILKYCALHGYRLDNMLENHEDFKFIFNKEDLEIAIKLMKTKFQSIIDSKIKIEDRFLMSVISFLKFCFDFSILNSEKFIKEAIYVRQNNYK